MQRKQLTDERLNANFLTFVDKLQKYNCYSESMIKDLGESIKNGSYSTLDKFGGAYRGSLVEVTLNVLCRIGFSINSMVFGMNEKGVMNFPLMCVNNDMLMRVLLLVNISKSEMYIPNTNDWKRSNGAPYDFNENLKSSLKTGQRTLYICNKYGIRLTEEEFEAIAMVDVEDDKSARFRSPLATIVMTALSLTLVELHQRYVKENKIEKEEE